MAGRILKSSIDWAKLKSVIPKYEMADYNAFRIKSEQYIRRAMELPENPPEIDWNKFKSLVSNKAAIEALEKSYKSTSVPYPSDNLSAEIDKQQQEEEQSIKSNLLLHKERIEEAEYLISRFKLLKPYHTMLEDDFARTYPQWCNYYGDTREQGGLELDPATLPSEIPELRKEKI